MNNYKKLIFIELNQIPKLSFILIIPAYLSAEPINDSFIDKSNPLSNKAISYIGEKTAIANIQRIKGNSIYPQGTQPTLQKFTTERNESLLAISNSPFQNGSRHINNSYFNTILNYLFLCRINWQKTKINNLFYFSSKNHFFNVKSEIRPPP
ncbi:MAG TPA: hypothetical protein VKY36_01110 [Moheibacter sp.]|nr:hypothetical protein [Moheibacter sp.]